jgi:hypothetical protein
MALLPPDSTPHRRRDRTEDAAAARRRARVARDLGDEQGQAWAHEPRRKRSRFTVGTAVVLLTFAGLGAVPVFLGGSDGQLLAAGCDRPAVEVGTARISAGSDFSWQAAGPEQGPYVVALDAAAVTGPVAGPVSPDTGRVLAGPTALPGCRSAQTLAAGPTDRGAHEVVLFRRTATGWERAAVVLLTVS